MPIPRLSLLLLALVLSALPSAAQENDDAVEVYPVRINHKVGFIKFYPAEDTVYLDTVIVPRYDYIAEENLPWNTIDKKGASSPYRLYELDERVGLLDTYLQEVLPNRYKRIRPLSEDYFALEEDSLFQLYDKKGTLLLNGDRYQDICLESVEEASGQMRFYVKKGMLWGLRRADGQTLLPPRFLRLLPAGTPGFYKVRLKNDDKQGWKIANQQGQILKLPPAQDVVVLNQNTVALRDDKARWVVMKKQKGKWEEIKGPLQHIVRLNGQCAVLHRMQPEEVVFWDFKNGKELWSKPAILRTGENTPSIKYQYTERPYGYYPWIYPLNEHYHIYCEGGTTEGFIERLIDNKGNGVSPAFGCILPTAKEDLYKVNRNGYWGLIAPRYWGNDMIACTYFDIAPFEQDVSIVLASSGVGAFSFRNGVLDSIPAVHDQVERSGKNYLAKMGDQVVLYELGADNQFAESAIFDGLSIVAQNTSRIKEAKAQPKAGVASYSPVPLDFGDLSVKNDNGVLLLIKMDRRDGRDEERWREPVPIPNLPPHLYETVDDQVFYYYEKAVARPTAEGISVGLANEVQPVRFYDLGERQSIPTPEIISIRPFDSAYQHTAFLTPDGQMGLIDRHGRECIQNGKPLRFTYIGPFQAGRARVCADAAWQFLKKGDDPPQPYKFSLGSPFKLRAELGIRQGSQAKTPFEGQLFLTDAPNKQRRWGYIDQQGRWLMEVDAGYVDDFHWQDSTAIFAKENGERDPYGHPDASYGVLNYDGSILLNCEYQHISRLADHYLMTVGNTPTFFFTQRGHEIFVNPTRMRPFSDGMAQFRDSNGLWGYVSQKGEVAIPAQYKKVRPFSDGLALVADSTGQCVYIDKQGRVAFRTAFTERQWRGLGDFHAGRAWFKGKGWSWGFYDRTGHTAFPPKAMLNLSTINMPKEEEAYILPLDFQQQLAAVQFVTAGGQTYAAVLDTSGQIVFEDKGLYRILPFNSHGIAVYQASKGSLYGLLKADGERLCPPLYKRIGNFSEGLAPAQTAEGQWGFLQTDGSLAIPAKYTQAEPFSEGLAAVRTSPYSGWQYINSKGGEVIPGPFDQASTFEEGIALVQYKKQSLVIDRAGLPLDINDGQPAFFSEGLLGINRPALKKQAMSSRPSFYADASGNNVFGQEYAEITPFQLGVAKVRPVSEENQARRPLGAINKRGVMVVPPKYRMLHIQPDGNIIINPQRFYGLANKKGEILLPPQFDRIDLMKEEGVYRVERGEKIGYYLMRGSEAEEVWPLRN
jgi:hypothetical protein